MEKCLIISRNEGLTLNATRFYLRWSSAIFRKVRRDGIKSLYNHQKFRISKFSRFCRPRGDHKCRIHDECLPPTLFSTLKAVCSTFCLVFYRLSCVLPLVFCCTFCLVFYVLSSALTFVLCSSFCLVLYLLSCVLPFVLCSTFCLKLYLLSCFLPLVLCSNFYLVFYLLSCVLPFFSCSAFFLVFRLLSCVLPFVLCSTLWR